MNKASMSTMRKKQEWGTNHLFRGSSN